MTSYTSLDVGGVPIVSSGNVPVTTGRYFFVHSGTGSNSNSGADALHPVATIDWAFGLCTANKYDIIVVMPGHAESLSGAAAIAADIAGVTVFGLGVGSLRPTLTLHTTTTTIAISAASITFQNFRITGDVDAVVKVFNITAASASLIDVEYFETAACACLQFVLTTAAATDLTITNHRAVQTATAATALQQWIVLTGADRFNIRNCFVTLKGLATANPANGVVVGAGTASLDGELRFNRFISTNSTGAIPISMLAGTTGFASNNYVASAKTAIAGQIALASMYGAENYASNTVNLNGLLDPVVDS